MAKKYDLNKVDSLDLEITLVQGNELIEQLKKTDKIFFKNGFKKTMLALIPIAGSAIVCLITKSYVPLTYGVGMLGVGAIYNELKESIKEDKEFRRSLYDSMISKEDIDEDDIKPQKVNTNKKDIYRGEDFYKEQYKDFLKRKEAPSTCELDKYNEALGKQRSRVKNNGIKIVKKEDEREYLSREETKEQIYYEMCVFANCYEFPPFRIQGYEFDIFFDETYRYFEGQGIKEKFYEKIDKVVRYALAQALIDVKRNNKQEVNIQDFIESLKNLKIDDIKEKDIVTLQRSILEVLKQTKVISIDDYLNNKGSRPGGNKQS